MLKRKKTSPHLTMSSSEPEMEIKQIKPVTRKRKDVVLADGSKTLNVRDGDRIIVKIEANLEEVGFHEEKWKTPTSDGKKQSFYAIAEIDKVEIKKANKTLLYPQPTIKPIVFHLADGRTIKIQPTAENEPAQKVPGIEEWSHLLTENASPDLSKRLRPFHTAVMFNAEGKQSDRSFVFVYFSGKSEMSEEMDQEQKEAVDGWFPNFISEFKNLLKEHEEEQETKKKEETRKKQENIRRLAEDPEFRRQRENLGNERGGVPRALDAKADTWSECERAVEGNLDEHLKWLGINRAMDTAGADVINRAKKEKSKMVNPDDKCPNSFVDKKQIEWITKAAGAVPLSKKQCEEAMQKVNNAFDEINKCF